MLNRSIINSPNKTQHYRIRYKLQGKPNFLDKQLKITKKVLDRFFV